MDPFRRRHFQMRVLGWNYFNFDQKSTKFVPKGPIDNKAALAGSCNGLAPGRRQVITWTNADPVHRRIYAALGGYELIWLENEAFSWLALASFGLGPFYWYGLTLSPVWISNHLSSKVWDQMIYPFPKFNAWTIEFWEWIISPALNNRCNHLSISGLTLIHVS